MSEKSRNKSDILVVYKKTSYERWRADGDPRIEELLVSGDASVEKLRSAHDAHLDTMNRARAALKKLGTKAVFRHKHAERPDERWDLVVTLGGDGTLLWASHQVDADTPMVAVNSDPTTSVGYFCAGDRGDVEETLAAALRGDLRPTKLTRMQVRVDGDVVHERVLNDILFCHEVPAATTRYLIEFGGVTESHICSGIWVGPAAGSTAAQRSAGGKVLKIGSRKLQWVVREPYRPGDITLQLAKGLVPADEVLKLKTKIRAGRIYLDGANKLIHVDVGSDIEMQRSREPLQLLGLRSRGR